ncbi:MAG: site-specific integrase [Brevundimonas sp.]|uniref:tyrosine-type recombinase/integrase n=1 Tax=Brevundimonas sp. TaxID=1871086 RepID=UPI001A35DA11|nr:site-specific integrase [Brevundimonas sp.]MBJ7318053.1 site-specific integrase [Brevundimonas sp.]
MRAAPDAGSLRDHHGQRKYLCGSEPRRFLAAAARMDAESGALCRLLAFTGCRVSEALQLCPERLDAEAGRIVFRTLKRRKLAFRAVPVPTELMRELRRLARGKQPDEPLWPWCRQTAWRRVRRAMAEAGITGVHASPKGLRHTFGVQNAEHNIPMPLTRDWMGHARIDTTAIYQHAVGREERSFARRLWRGFAVEP